MAGVVIRVADPSTGAEGMVIRVVAISAGRGLMESGCMAPLTFASGILCVRPLKMLQPLKVM